MAKANVQPCGWACRYAHWLFAKCGTVTLAGLIRKGCILGVAQTRPKHSRYLGYDQRTSALNHCRGKTYKYLIPVGRLEPRRFMFDSTGRMHTLHVFLNGPALEIT